MVTKPTHRVIQITMQNGVRQTQSRLKHCRYSPLDSHKYTKSSFE